MHLPVNISSAFSISNFTTFFFKSLISKSFSLQSASSITNFTTFFFKSLISESFSLQSAFSISNFTTFSFKSLISESFSLWSFCRQRSFFCFSLQNLACNKKKTYEITVKALHLSTLKVTYNDDKNDSQLYTATLLHKYLRFYYI